MPRAECIGGLCLALAGSVAAQDAPAPPRILPDGPGSVSLAPLPGDRATEMEEIVVIGRSEWRLPDLGSSLGEATEREQGRWRASFLPLYDPETPMRGPELLEVTTAPQRVNYIELFRVRFGPRPPE